MQEQCLLFFDRNEGSLSPGKLDLNFFKSIIKVTDYWKKKTFNQATGKNIPKHLTWHKTKPKPKITNSISISISNIPSLEHNLSNDLIKKFASK